MSPAEHEAEPVTQPEAAQEKQQAGGHGTDDTDAPESTGFIDSGWRVEVLDKGQRFVMRTGSGDLRQTAKGGEFGALPQERQEHYERNKKFQSTTKAAARIKRAQRK